MAHRTALYRFFAADGSLLYVGITFDPDARQRQHERTAAMTWWPLQARRTVEWFDSRPAAEAAEKQAIKQERPRFNERYNLHMGREARAAASATERAKERRRAAAGILSDLGRVTQGVGAADYLRRKIDAGSLPAGQILPNRKDLGERLGVSDAALKAAFVDLVTDGYIEHRPAKGYFVLSAEARTVRIPVGLPETAAAILRATLSDDQLAELTAALQAGVPLRPGA